MIAILGAGRSERFHGQKLSAELGGRALGLWPVAAAQELNASILYITSPEPPQFLADAGLEIAINPHRERGMGSSIALAAARAQASAAERLLVLLGDMPFVSHHTLERLIAAAETASASACCYPDGRLGPPACFGRALFGALTRLDGDRGAQGLLNGLDAIAAIEVPGAELFDIDTLGDLAEARFKL